MAILLLLSIKIELYVAAMYTDENDKWDPAHYNTRNLHKLVKRVQKDLPDNRLVEHLGNCSLTWHCCTAQNLFYRRWEAGIPSSPVCNANCFGCISLQPAECCPSPQSRIKFRPTPKEIAQIGIYHLETAPDAIISFGQGCEGEPSLAVDNIVPAIEKIRKKTDKGQININTNAGYTEGIKRIVDAGLDSMRVSIISAIPENYKAYYRGSYELDNVKESIRYAHEHGVHISLNMLYFPGFNDSESEFKAWKEFLHENTCRYDSNSQFKYRSCMLLPKSCHHLLKLSALKNLFANYTKNSLISSLVISVIIKKENKSWSSIPE